MEIQEAKARALHSGPINKCGSGRGRELACMSLILTPTVPTLTCTITMQCRVGPQAWE